MADLLALSSRFIDSGIADEPVNRLNGQLSEVADGVAMIEAFSHVVLFKSDDGLVLFDTSLESFGGQVLKSMRGWSDDAVRAIAYTHGHIDHVGGAAAIVHEARERGRGKPQVIGHENVQPRFARYELTNGYNAAINARQFGGAGGGGRTGMAAGSAGHFGPAEWIAPDTEFSERMGFASGALRFELRHARGETDDHLWAWEPQRKAVVVGDFLTWVFPNAGNPQKVQRFPLDWAEALRAMAALEPELLLPAHGLPIAGRARIAKVLDEVAGSLESLVRQTLEMMNAGARLDAIVHAVRLPKETLEKPYLKPIYDEPEFVVRNIWRQYGGWYDGNPSHLKPAPDAAVAHEMAMLAGGAGVLADRALALSQAGEHRLACHFAEMAALAEPDSHGVHGRRAEVYEARMKAELSLMARGIYGAAARSSREVAGKND
ncbi:MAG TPA: alkyl sulfatase dimerization domain-containing protein [Rhizomicrobium sp.]|jgi:alkyl sulfatase BDS1-like metallo-beta-lactamase superfamily hydrolase|nr:alkyl sulfatase dimerization domain-containing protein [Rhizomicrobium sp.]